MHNNNNNNGVRRAGSGRSRQIQLLREAFEVIAEAAVRVGGMSDKALARNVDNGELLDAVDRLDNELQAAIDIINSVRNGSEDGDR